MTGEIREGYYWVRADGIRGMDMWVPVQIGNVVRTSRGNDRLVYFFNAEEMSLSGLLSRPKVELRLMESPQG